MLSCACLMVTLNEKHTHFQRKSVSESTAGRCHIERAVSKLAPHTLCMYDMHLVACCYGLQLRSRSRGRLPAMLDLRSMFAASR